ncbi:MAG: ThiF family adenylyltransferase, partial [Patescibacteria group bacterium]
MIQAPLVLQAEEIPSSAKRVDALDDALTELFFIDNPIFKRGMPGVEDKIKEYVNSKNEEGIWIYFPWRDLAIRTLSEDLYFLLRTSRNRNIITHEEQLKYRAGKIGVAGLSVGSWVVSALVSSGGPQTLKIADFDVVEITNLNRIQAKLTDVKNPKIEVAAREVWELDPFAKLHLWDKGVSADTLRDFIIGEPRLDVFVDAMDSLDLKILSRFICQENRVPLVMGTDNGERVILDVERFDLEPNRPIFHGVVDIYIDVVKKN